MNFKVRIAHWTPNPGIFLLIFPGANRKAKHQQTYDRLDTSQHWGGPKTPTSKVLSIFRRENDDNIDLNRKGSEGTCFVCKLLILGLIIFRDDCGHWENRIQKQLWSNNSQHSILTRQLSLSAFCILTHLVFIATLRISATNGESEAQRGKKKWSEAKPSVNGRTKNYTQESGSRVHIFKHHSLVQGDLEDLHRNPQAHKLGELPYCWVS